jgi:hypothetical protein
MVYFLAFSLVAVILKKRMSTSGPLLDSVYTSTDALSRDLILIGLAAVAIISGLVAAFLRRNKS